MPVLNKKYILSKVFFSHQSSMQLGGFITFCQFELFWAWECKHILDSKNQRRKILEIHKNFELYQFFTVFKSSSLQLFSTRWPEPH